nr:PREDICTED: uncharacterized protein LOC103281259 [Anolis carolinensis]|eukprot:XP_008120660.2 PREDICTED: uncharacterized protein LOC103281259 [Anolis carolinensis]
MVPAKYFVLAWAVLQSLFSPCKSLRFHFVKAGVKAEIQFDFVETPDDEGMSFNWYKARSNEEIPLFVESCGDDKSEGKFVCKRSREKLVLEIYVIQMEDSGRYLCGSRAEDILVVSALVVGDSYTPSTQVMVLHPAAQSPSSQNMQSNQLACVVHGVSNLVEVSWEVSGGVQQKGQTFLLNEDSISLTFVSLLPIPKEVQSRGGKMTCEVRFNSSGTTVKKSTMFNASSSEDHDGKCPLYAVSRVVVGGLALLMLLLLFFGTNSVLLNQI